MEKSTIRIRRKQDLFGMYRKMKIFINEKHVTDLKYDQTIDLHVSPVFHTVRVKINCQLMYSGQHSMALM